MAAGRGMAASGQPTAGTAAVPLAAAGKRLDVYAATLPGITSRSMAQRLIEAGELLVDGGPARPSFRLSGGERVTYTIPPPEPSAAEPEEIPLEILHEDDDLIVVNKPRGMVVHPAAGNRRGTLVNAVLGHAGSLSGVGGVMRPGIVHRLDKDTSGVMVVAKNDPTHLHLAAQFKAHRIDRRYVALVKGHLPSPEGTISGNIGRHPRHRKKMAVVQTGGKPAVTHWRVLEEFPGYTLLEARLETGRTHQIRVHLSHIGHPVAGDPVYGGQPGELGLQGQALHAAVLAFRHPRTGQELSFRTAPPADFQAAVERLRGAKISGL
ncbi:MAG: RluA family pseudouridine synthase [Betaproteobacteria bacterium]